MKTEETVTVKCIKKHNGFTKGKKYKFPFPIEDNGEKKAFIFNLENWSDIFKQIK